MLAVDLETTLADEMMAKADRMTMAWGLEARVPLLDHRVVELALQMAPHVLRSGPSGKLPLRQLARRHLGDHVAQRPKLGFNTSFARDLAEPAAVRRVDELMERSLGTGLFDAQAAVALRRDAEHDPGAGQALFALLVTGLWASQRGVVA